MTNKHEVNIGAYLKENENIWNISLAIGKLSWQQTNTSINFGWNRLHFTQRWKLTSYLKK